MARRKTWVFQDSKEIERLGAKYAAWSVGWRTSTGKRRRESCGPGKQGKAAAILLARRKQVEIDAGVDGDRPSRTTWEDFLEQFSEFTQPRIKPQSWGVYEKCLTHLSRVLKPEFVDEIDSQGIDRFIAARASEMKYVRGTQMSPATINRDLRHVKSALQKAKRWKMIAEMPEFSMLREPTKDKRVWTPDEFAAAYDQCEIAKKPAGYRFKPADWWRGLFVFGWMTGWRIGELRSVHWNQIDLDKGVAKLKHGDTKGGRDETIALHDLVIEHLRVIQATTVEVFPWKASTWRPMYDQLRKICDAAEVPTTGFHDLRRSFATENADRLSGPTLQRLMRHRAFATTLKYLNLAKKLRPAVENLAVPPIKRKAT